MSRHPFKERKLYLVSQVQRDTLLALIPTLPLDSVKPLEIIIRERVKGRKLSQQALLFAGPMRDISEQAWFDGRQFSVQVLHEFCKRQFLPEDFGAEMCKEGYVKWGVDPLGERALVGSTTELTVRGYSQYIEQIHAFGANLGVEFHASPTQEQS